MKNLFDYATKELSQDAFLRWLFESWEDEEIKPVVKSLLKEFCNINEDIEYIKTKAQEKNIDIKVEILTKEQRRISLFIEDKTFSCEHNQLKTYDKYIDSLSEEVYKIFYKTSKISDRDEIGINDANTENGNIKWQKVDIYKIVNLFKSNFVYNNLILRQYVEYIESIEQALKITEKPLHHDSKLDLLKWESFFNNVVIPNLTKEGYRAYAWKAGPYPYICLVIKKNGYIENQPYLEITSRDCLNDNFSAKVLLYYVDQATNQEKIQKLKENVKQSCFIQQNNKQQIGLTKKGLTAKTSKEFIEQVEKYAKEFLFVMKDWN